MELNTRIATSYWTGNFTHDLDVEVTENRLGRLRPRSILELGCSTGKNTQLVRSL